MPTEPFDTALLLAVLALLLGVSVLLSRASGRTGTPVALAFLLIGIAAGSEGIGGIAFENYGLAYRLGTVALTLILFDGGLNTSLAAVRKYARPAAVLATIGVVGIALVVAAGARWLGIAWPIALLLGAVVSSTDAAAVFSVLRNAGVSLKRRVGVTLEVESGINDPMAVILTTVFTESLLRPADALGWRMPAGVAIQLVVGLAFGVGVGLGGRWMLGRVRLSAGGLYPVVTIALALLAFSVPTLLNGSGFLAVYIAAVILGNGELPYRTSLLRVHDALAWLSQIAMFLVLGLLVFPSRLLEVWWIGLALALFLAVVARPLVVVLCLLPFRYPARDTAYISWVGLRGAVPIILATFPVLAGAPGAERVFDIVFFIVVASTIIPGTTVAWFARRLDLESDDAPAPAAVLEIEASRPFDGQLLSFYVDEALAVTGVPIADLPFPEGAAATLVVRGRRLIAPKGNTVLEPGDHVYVLAPAGDEAHLRLMFGRPEGD